MRILPVLDIKDRIVVHGIAGQRDQYRPITSRLTSSCQPIEVARAFHKQFGLTEIYIADLDAIMYGQPNLSVYDELQSQGFRLWLDAGIKTANDARRLPGCHRLVAGLETISGPEVLHDLVQQRGGENVAFSLDLHRGQPLGNRQAWNDADALAIAEQARSASVQAIIVLDLSRVGVGDGIGTEELCRQLVARHPDIEWVAGGGVRNMDDLHRLQRLGLTAVLVASALHDGRITPQSVASLE
ncbi:MAG: nickel transporter [Gemmatales bacterium]|nr:MAG: nickel transporter [Gemmatales bacterium]